MPQDETFKSVINMAVNQLKSRIQLAEGTFIGLINSVQFTQVKVIQKE